MIRFSKTLAALLLCGVASLTQAAETAICYNCPPEWADWGTQLKAIADSTGVQVPLDDDIVVACLQRLRTRDDLPYVGLIGSKTKWATFRRRLEARGFSQDEMARITCPIGVPGIGGKEPEVIAVAVAAQLLQSLDNG